MINYTLNVGIVYSIYVLAVLIIKLFSPKTFKVQLPKDFEKSFKIDKWILYSLIISEIVLIFSLVFKCQFVLFFRIPLPTFIRTIGLVLAYFGTLVIVVSLFKLGRAYSPTLNIENGQKLVKTGIYKYIRHPFYTGLITLHIGVPLALSNALVAFVWVSGVAVLLWHRIPNEEALLEYYFKDEFVEYKNKTGLFFPKFGDRNKMST